MSIKIPRLLGSSVNPEKLALRIKALLVGVVPTILWASGLFGFDIGPEVWQNGIELMIEIVTKAGAAIAAAMELWGWVRMIVGKIKTWKENR